jgi:hypothetical protein
MGLDIAYFSNIRKVKLDDEDEDDVYNHDLHTQDNDFIYQLGSLKRLSAYDTTSDSEIGRVRMGAYSTYNNWRNQLAIIAGYGSAQNVWNDEDFDPMATKFYNLRYLKLKKLKDPDFQVEIIKPFYPLINFTDCDGVIGPEICKSLYQDFVYFYEKAKQEGGYFYEKYEELMEAFRVASQKGAVVYR